MKIIRDIGKNNLGSQRQERLILTGGLIHGDEDANR